MQFIIIKSLLDIYCLHVFNCGYLIAVHNSQSEKYIKSRVRNYKQRMARPTHAGHGRKTHEFWAVSEANKAYATKTN